MSSDLMKNTKQKLCEMIVAQGAELHDLRRKNDELRAQLDMLLTKQPTPKNPEYDPKRYPLVDRLGRHYRLEGNVKCYPPIH